MAKLLERGDLLTIQVLTKQWYADVLARIRINAFRIEVIAASYKDLPSAAAASVEAEAGVGNAVYILPSFYNHDCGELLSSFLSVGIISFFFI